MHKVLHKKDGVVIKEENSREIFSFNTSEIY